MCGVRCCDRERRCCVGVVRREGKYLRIAELCKMMQEEYVIVYTCATMMMMMIMLWKEKVWSCKCGCCGEESEVCVRKRFK